ncbi:MAG TPA: hypothetical protein VKY54_14035 [Kiloniellales bacterium]|jgi:hypothetical protein|nr:hypothetical protein [Kiloniellales bacterium]
MEALLIASILVGVTVSKIGVEIAAEPLAHNLQMVHGNWFWSLDPARASDRELLQVVEAVLPRVEVLEELCSVPGLY